MQGKGKRADGEGVLLKSVKIKTKGAGKVGSSSWLRVVVATAAAASCLPAASCRMPHACLPALLLLVLRPPSCCRTIMHTTARDLLLLLLLLTMLLLLLFLLLL